MRSITPERAGISSGKVRKFLEVLESYGLSTHGIIMARGEDIFLECYYAPFDKDTKHRMYSVSKSFITLAVGLAVEEGLLSLDDRMMKYFPEYDNGELDERFYEATIRDMLTMRSSMVDYAQWWGKEDRAATYFTEPSRQIPGTNFYYDSAGSFLICAIIEKLTGKPYIEYLKEKCLVEMGFSKDAYCLVAPGGYSHSDSGLMCTARDLLIFARLLMNGGTYGGKRYISEDFIREATTKQTDNDLLTPEPLRNLGYGYLIWMAPRGGFALRGLGNQLVICDPLTDFVFIITSENAITQPVGESIIVNELYHHFIPELGEALPENPEEYAALEEHVRGARLVSLEGGVNTDFESYVNGKKYVLEDNANGIRYVRFTFEGESGAMEYEDENGVNYLRFGIGYNEFGLFPGKKKMSTVASQYVEGQYKAATSAIWCEEKKLHIMSQVIDEYLGKVHIVAAFKDGRVSILMQKRAQRILDNYDGFLVGKIEE